MSTRNHPIEEANVILIGAGIMSATLGTLFKQLEPGTTIEVFERLDSAAAESSDAWNNAGTGHSAFCELNYTPEREDGSIDTTKAVKMLIMDVEGKPKHLYKMKSSDFPQPEGIDFNEKGELFISNEGGKGKGTILKVALP